MITLRPQDVVILLKLSLDADPQTLADLGLTLGISASEIHGALRRASAATLLDPRSRRPRTAALLEFLEHGIRYVFISRRGEITRGVPTAFSAAPLKNMLSGHAPVVGRLRDAETSHEQASPPSSGLPTLAEMYEVANPKSNQFPSLTEMFVNPPIVWPHPEGQVRGEGLEPLYPSCVEAARRDPRLHECLALVDALRIGRARERKLAIDLLRERL